jgi:hypothetical protein
VIDKGDLVEVVMPDGSVRCRMIVTDVGEGRWGPGSSCVSGVRDWTDDLDPSPSVSDAE